MPLYTDEGYHYRVYDNKINHRNDAILFILITFFVASFKLYY